MTFPLGIGIGIGVGVGIAIAIAIVVIRRGHPWSHGGDPGEPGRSGGIASLDPTVPGADRRVDAGP
jgi:hypothetical protein